MEELRNPEPELEIVQIPANTPPAPAMLMWLEARRRRRQQEEKFLAEKLAEMREVYGPEAYPDLEVDSS